jgi:hypothetical protein
VLEIPNISTKLSADLDPLAVSFRQGIAAAGRFKKDMERALYDLQPLRKSFSADEGAIRKGVADAIRVARAELAGKNRALDVGGFDPIAEARQRFAGTAAAAKQVASATENWTDKAIKGAAIVKGIQGAVLAVAAGVELWRSRQADVAGQFEKASQGYLKFAETIQSIPIVGNVASELANAFSGGAGDAAKKALADAAQQDDKTKQMVKTRTDANNQVAASTKRAQAESLTGIEKEITLAALARDEAIAGIRKQLQEKQIGGDLAKRAIEAENAKFDTALNERMQKQRADAEQQAQEEKKGAEEAKKRLTDPLDALKAEVGKFDMSDAQKGLFDFKQLKGVTSDQVAEYTKLAGKLDELKKKHDLGDEVKKWKESIKGPVDQYDEAIAKLRQWRREGQITQEDFDKGVGAAKDELENSAPDLNKARQQPQEPRLVAAVEAGSAAAVRLQFSNGRGDKQTQLTERQLKKQDEHKKLLEQIRDRLNLKEG